MSIPRWVWVVPVLLVLAAVYFWVDPAEAAWLPRCPLHSLTGLQCPGCGSQRMVHALLHGDLAGAWHANAFLVASLPALAFLLWLEFNRRRYSALYARIYTMPFIITVSVLLVVWGVARNILEL